MDFVGLVAVVMGLSIPLSAIIGAFYVKIKKLNAEGGMTAEEMEQLKAVLRENKDLKERVNNLETIVTEMDAQLRQLPEGDRD